MRPRFRLAFLACLLAACNLPVPSAAPSRVSPPASLTPPPAPSPRHSPAASRIPRVEPSGTPLVGTPLVGAPPIGTSPAALPSPVASPARRGSLTPPETRPTRAPSASPAGVDEFFARCPSAQEVRQVDASLQMSFESDPSAGTLACRAEEGSADLSPLQKRAYQSVLVMRFLRFSRPLPWTDLELYDWFTGVIRGIRFRSDIDFSYCCDPQDTINVRVAPNTNLLLTDRWVDPALGGGLMNSMLLFVHEARHNQGLYHTCPDAASDRRVDEMGAWGVQMRLLEWMADASPGSFLDAPAPQPQAYRDLARRQAQEIRATRFCEE